MVEVKEFDNKIKVKKLNNAVAFTICVLIAFLTLLICSPNSFLYSFNSNQDVNWYITMGRAMVDGKIMYKDLFDHKGPLLYLLFAFIALFKHPYIAVFILELVCNSLFLFVGYKIFRKYLSEYVSLIAVSILAFVTYTSYYRVLGGGAVEEYFLPIIAYMVLSILEFTETKKHFSILRSILLGVGIGAIFWVKFSVLSAVLAFLIVWLVFSIKNKQIKVTIYSILFMILGFILTCVPVVIYFAVTKSFSYLFDVYFYTNLTAYNGGVNIFSNLGKFFKYGPIVAIFILFGIVSYIVKNKKSGIAYLSMFLINFVILVLQKSFKYYFVQLIPYAILGVAMFCQQFVKIGNFKMSKQLGYFITVVLCLIFTAGISFTTVDIGKNRKEYPQIEIANTINNISNTTGNEKTLFCYKIWDYGFYNAAGIIPNVRFYAKNEFDEKSLPEMYKVFDEAITNQQTEYIVTTIEIFEKEKDYLTKYYHQYTNNSNNGVFRLKLTEPYKATYLEFVLLIKN